MKAIRESHNCQRGCCWNNFGICGRTYVCRCHASRDSSAAARARLEDFLDSLGDE
jgi:hypothetical protein